MGQIIPIVCPTQYIFDCKATDRLQYEFSVTETTSLFNEYMIKNLTVGMYIYNDQKCDVCLIIFFK